MTNAGERVPDACANPRCLNGANCPGHPWRENELGALEALRVASRDMNDEAYRGSGFRMAREFFRGRLVECKEELAQAHSETDTRRMERDDARLSLSREAETRGRLEGERDAAAWPGVIEGWRARAETAEQALGTARELLDAALQMLPRDTITIPIMGHTVVGRLHKRIADFLAGLRSEEPAP